MAYKVLLLNGSPHAKGCTARALEEMIRTLNEEGVGTTLLQIGNGDVRGCISCGYCHKNGRCVFDDKVNEAARLLEEADGLVIVDYKTDRVKEEAELTARYHSQLELYAKALEQITDKKVKETWIYSFSLEKAILTEERSGS